MDNHTVQLTQKLAAAGCQHPEQAAKNIELLAPDAAVRSQLEAVLPSLLTGLKRVPDPDLALNNLERFNQAVLDRRFLLGLLRDNPRILHLLLTIFGSSQFLSDILVRHPQLFEWLLEPGIIRRPKRKEELAEEARQVAAAAPTLERKWSALRRFKVQEILRIGLQDLLGRQTLAGITEELSNLADVILETAYAVCRADLSGRHGLPQLADDSGRTRECPFVILGLGKLGGRELNFSSDIDLVFVYEGEGETPGIPGAGGGPLGRIGNQEFFRKLGEMLVKGVGETSPEGHLYRVDLRLRPEGRSGGIASSLRACEVYYESWGQTWERQALIKTRPVAGDPALGEAFQRLVVPFVYRQYLDFAALEEIRAMKERINLAVREDRRARRNVKLGYGGIREIEFLVQGFQLLQGGKNPWVREANTLRALHRLAGLTLLADADYEVLVRAYLFLRKLEHRLQILHDRQTHTLPEAPRELATLARRMGYQLPEHPDPAASLLTEYERHTSAVRTLYDAFLQGILPRGEEPAEEAADPLALFFHADLPAEQLRNRLASVGFEDLDRALRNFLAIREGQPFAHAPPQSRRALARLAPALVAALEGVPDPDLALTTFERFITTVAARTTFLTLLADTQGLLSLLVRLFGTSEFLSATLLHHPELLDALLTPEPAARHGRERVAADLRRALAGAETSGARLDALRRVKKAEELRIGLQDILDRADVTETHRVLTHLAEACLEAALQMAERDLTDRFGTADPPGFAIVALGKLGGRELSYASDLDLAFVYRGEGTTTGPERISHTEYFSKLADRITKILTSITQEGAVYRVDTRLRPGGQKGELAQPLLAFENHFIRMAELWERQAYIKARPVAGDPALGGAFLAQTHRFVYESPEQADLAERIQAMRHRLEMERGGGGSQGAHVKLGSGGIVDIEFLAQYLQLRHGRSHPDLRTPGTLEALRGLATQGLLPPEDAAVLEESYRFLRRVENRLRIVADLSVNTLPAAPAKLEKLAKRMGYRPQGDDSARERFQKDYAAHTGRVRAIYNRVFGTKDAGRLES
ncbi:MAG: bifunctional [glutamate--ammonia ligase]-adenylyl-L-tyrosine phosphorylase/[glutamate--ammonia-ligase] adenylyltransferase [candidate division NC10 bacterium]|nr:bifunctional [glutamate--ammonia ligase]-adenylyl-L-tyrosine phosphorylase/[glutamate--ammonia-ligase] adenylyltransferase [candidate division NC10 bacterium]